MIKKLLLFVMLLGVGFSAVYLATGGDIFASFGGTESVRQETDPDSATPGISVPIGDEHSAEVGKDLEVSYRGSFQFQDSREIELPNGETRLVQLYSLDSENSAPQDDGTWKLEEVEVNFYETGGPAEDPEAVQAGVLRARLAYVEIGRDEDGKRSIAMDRDIILHDAVLVTNERARVKNVTMTMKRALVRSTESALLIRTAEDTMPFEVRIAAAGGPAVLSGRGLHAEFPTGDKSERSRPASIEVSSEPVLYHHGKRGDSRLSADGPLKYLENAATGIAVITASGNVRVETAGGSFLGGDTTGENSAGPLIATGEHLRATLQRSKSKDAGGRPQIGWRSMHLVGGESTRAGLVGRGMALSCDAVDVTPNLDGDPWLFTARGSPLLEHEEGGRTMRFTAAERIHLVRIATHLGPWLRGRGWSSATMSSQLGEFLIFEGASSLELPQGEDELELQASGGLRVLRGLEGTEQMTVLGLGTVQLDSHGTTNRLHLTGSDGFLLQADSEGQTLRLGPEELDPGHRFELTTGELAAVGSGAFTLFRPTAADQPGEITLASPKSDIELTIPGTEGKLGQVATLTAAFDAGSVRQFDARGAACRLIWEGKQGAIDGTAAHIHSTSAETWFLEGQPAVVVSDRGKFEGERIRIARLTDDDALLEATGQAHLRARDLATGAATAAGEIDLAAERILYLPFAAPRALARCWLALPTSLHNPHLLAWQNVVVQHLDDAGHPINHARGETLVLELRKEPAGRLRGAPAVVTRRDSVGQDIVAAAPLVTLAGGGGQTLSLIPEGAETTRITIGNRRGPLASFGSEDGSTRVICRGAIDVTDQQILFGGPVTVQSLGPGGAEEADGFHVAAEGMRMTRNPETGEIESVHTSDGTELRWRGIEVKARGVTIDLVRHWCTLVDHSGQASLVLPNGSSARCSRAEFNYLTYENKIWGMWMAEDRATK